jgi:hypothetical protein
MNIGIRHSNLRYIFHITTLFKNNLLVLDSSVDRRTDRIKRNLGNQSVGD